MTAREKRGKKPKQSTEAKADKHDPVRPAVPSSCPSSAGGLVWDQRSRPATAIPFLLPAANKGSDKKPAQVKTGLTPFRAQGSRFGADFTPHPSCLPPQGGGWDAERRARLAGWTQKPRGHGRGSTGRATRQLRTGRSREASVLPAVPVSHVGRSEIADFGFCFLLPTEQGQVPAYGHGESKVSHSLIEEQQGERPTRRARGAMHVEMNPRAHGKRFGCCRTHLLLVGPKEGQAGNTSGFGIGCFQRGRIMRLHRGSPRWP